MATVELGTSLKQIKDVRRHSYLSHKQIRDYPTYRDIENYEHNLPRFKGGSFIEHIDDKIARGLTNIDFLDLGCGQGIVLAQLVTRYPQFVIPRGLTSFDYRSIDSLLNKLTQQSAKHIDYRVGDAQRLRSAFFDVRFDIVVSLHAMEYLADPLATLKQAYALCKEGGIIFFDRLGAALTITQADLLEGLWKQEGITGNLHRFAPRDSKYDPSLYSLAIQRGSNPRLPLPFRYSKPYVEPTTSRGHGNIENIYEVRLGYSFDEQGFERKKK